MQAEKHLALGVDLGGTKIYTLLADARGAVVAEEKRPVPPGRELPAVLDEVLQSIAGVLRQAGESLRRHYNLGQGNLRQEKLREAAAAADAAGDTGPSFAGRPSWLSALSPGAGNCLAAIKEYRRQLESAGMTIAGLGLGIAAVVSSDGRTVRQAPNLGWKEVPLADWLEAALEMKVYMDNDTNVAALGEYCFGGAAGTDFLVYIGVGTGIGGGIIAGGKLFRGSSGGAAEIGHIAVEPQGPCCSLGHPGCLEAMASGTAIGRMAREEVRKGRGARLLELAGGDVSRVTAQVVGEALQEGDPAALEVVRRAGSYLGMGVATVINVLNPAVVVIGGGAANLGEPLFAAVEEEVKLRAFPALREAVRIVPSRLRERVGGLGAAALVFTSGRG